MLRSHQVDIVGPLCLQFKKDLRKTLRGELDQPGKPGFSSCFFTIFISGFIGKTRCSTEKNRCCSRKVPAGPGDLPVLAVDAAQIAAGKENSPAAVPSGDHGLFRVVKSGACRPEHTAFAAEAALSLQPVHMTVPGTQGAVRENADGV